MSFAQSYPDGVGEDEVDALGNAPTGFIWDAATEYGKTIRNCGEFMTPAVRCRAAAKADSPGFTACFRPWKNGTNGESYFRKLIPAARSPVTQHSRHAGRITTWLSVALESDD